MTEPQDPFAPPPEGTGPSLSKDPAPSAPPPPPYGAPAPAPYGMPVPDAPRRNGFGVAALVLGLLGMTCLLPFVIPAVLGIVFGVLGRGRVRRGEATNGGMALAGVICGSLGVLFAVVIYGFVLTHLDELRRYSDCMDAASGSKAAEQTCADDLGRDLFGIEPR